MIDCYMTHRCALEMEVVMMLTDFQKGQGIHSVETNLAKFRNIAGSLTALQFYSFQSNWRAAKEQHIFADDDIPSVCYLRHTVSSVSDSYLKEVLHQWYYEMEEYMLLWSEQHLTMETCASDHHMKYSMRVREQGARMTVVSYKCMNTKNGSFPISTLQETTSYDDATCQRAHDGYNKASQRHKHPETIYAVCDFPGRDSNGLLHNIFPARGNELLVRPDTMQVLMVGDQESQCNDACQKIMDILHNVQDPMLFWDTESVAFVTGEGKNEQRCSLVQVCVNESLTVLFQVAAWSMIFPSFQTLFEISTICKVAHFATHDVKHLTNRFPHLRLTNVKDLKDILPEAFPPGKSKGLDAAVWRCCHKYLNKRIDHRLWCLPSLMPRHVEYAVLDVYAMHLVREAVVSARATQTIDQLKGDDLPNIENGRVSAQTIMFKSACRRCSRCSNGIIFERTCDYCNWLFW
jgi:hypothetical protein